jgi:hypothetical protein
LLGSEQGKKKSIPHLSPLFLALPFSSTPNLSFTADPQDFLEGDRVRQHKHLCSVRATRITTIEAILSLFSVASPSGCSGTNGLLPLIGRIAEGERVPYNGDRQQQYHKLYHPSSLLSFFFL